MLVFGNMHKLHEFYVHNRKKHMLPFFSNGCVAITIDFIRYLYVFLLKSYFFKTDYFIFIELAVS